MGNLYANGSAMDRGTPLYLKQAVTETASTTGGGQDTGLDGSALYVQVNVTAASGTTPTLTVAIEGSMDGGTSWFLLGTVGQAAYSVGTVDSAPANITGVSANNQAVFPCPQLVRARSVIGGTTPSFTYTVNAVVVG